MFLRDQIVKIRHGGADRFVQVESGPFKLFTNSHNQSYQGWILLKKDDIYGEPSTVCFNETEAVVATEEEVAANSQGRINFREASF